VGAWSDVPGGSTPSEALFDKGLTDAKEGGNGTLGAEPLLAGAENLLSQVQGLGFHAPEPNAVLPYIQSRTALASHYCVCQMPSASGAVMTTAALTTSRLCHSPLGNCVVSRCQRPFFLPFCPR
jgi:hypothetical protein